MIKTVNVIGLGALGMLFGGFITDNIGDRGEIHYVMDRARFERHKSDKYTVNKQPRVYEIQPVDDAKPADLLLIGVKYPGLDAALDMMKPCLDDHTIIMSMMNGVNSEEKIHEKYPNNTIIYTVPQGMDAMRFGTDMVYSQAGALFIGLTPNADEAEKEALDQVVEFFEYVKMPYVVDPDIMYRMWFKYMLNVGTNQTCMVYNVSYGKLTESGSEQYVTYISAMREVKEIAAKRGITLTEDDIEHVVEMENTLDPEATPSMGQDRMAKRHSEVDMFAGVVIKLGKEYGIRTPANEYLYRRVKEIEAEY